MNRAGTARASTVLLVLMGIPSAGMAQGAAASQSPPAIEDTITAAETDAPARRLVKFNEYEGPLGSTRIGLGLLWDYATFDQETLNTTFEAGPTILPGPAVALVRNESGEILNTKDGHASQSS